MTIATPVGCIKPVVELSREGDEFTGVAHGVGEEVPLRDVAVDGVALTGTSKAGRLPASKVTGRRRVTGTD
ncbi:hypothetical protein OG588_00890 [Streptomyces prunicolor]|uniref:hypothetical protein n=1 Tax=Streptomyces prunicolor TaxID=67348 RepID=UPI00386E305F|nr:hypothetical protein OG588_00890 [Streptomyces prunicolor]